MVRLKWILPMLLLSLSTACTSAPADTADTLSIVTTTNLLGDLTASIGGQWVSVTPLMGPGVDPHLYQASAGDVTTLTNADVIVYNGLHLEAAMSQVFEALDDKAVVCIQDGLTTAALLPSSSPGFYDPHIWFDVSLWQEAAIYVAEQLSALDPAHSTAYSANLDAYIADLADLDAYIKEAIAQIPETKRVLITAHDAFGYFGQAYGFEVLGIQGISTATEAGTGDISALATYIAEQEIPAIFVESSVSSRTIEALQAAVEAKGFSIAIGGSLYSDSLGDATSGHDNYCAMFRANVDTIVAGLIY